MAPQYAQSRVALRTGRAGLLSCVNLLGPARTIAGGAAHRASRVAIVREPLGRMAAPVRAVVGGATHWVSPAAILREPLRSMAARRQFAQARVALRTDCSQHVIFA